MRAISHSQPVTSPPLACALSTCGEVFVLTGKHLRVKSPPPPRHSPNPLTIFSTPHQQEWNLGEGNKICISIAKTGIRRKDMSAKLLGGGGGGVRLSETETTTTWPWLILLCNWTTSSNFHKLQLLGDLGVSVYRNKLYLSWWVVGGLLGRVLSVLSSWQETPRHTVLRTPGKGFNFHRPLEHLRVFPQELQKVAGGEDGRGSSPEKAAWVAQTWTWIGRQECRGKSHLSSCGPSSWVWMWRAGRCCFRGQRSDLWGGIFYAVFRKCTWTPFTIKGHNGGRGSLYRNNLIGFTNVQNMNTGKKISGFWIQW